MPRQYVRPANLARAVKVKDWRKPNEVNWRPRLHSYRMTHTGNRMRRTRRL
jgi:hypothetical protein